MWAMTDTSCINTVTIDHSINRSIPANYIFFIKSLQYLQIKSKEQVLISAVIRSATSPGEHEEQYGDAEVGGGHVDPDVQRKRRHERKQTWCFFLRLLVDNTDTWVSRESFVILPN